MKTVLDLHFLWASVECFPGFSKANGGYQVISDHDKQAIESHWANVPDAIKNSVLIETPECSNFSNNGNKGGDK